MIELMIVCGLILLICISSSKILYKFGIPMLLIFIVLGMIFGSDGIVGIYFDNYQLTSIVSSLALVFIMFYGGFGTNWKMARKSAVPSILMSSFGVIITAGLTGLFCHYVLKTSILEGLLIGAVVGSTDAASVFSVLRSQKLNLKGTLAPLLEIESGSNDPIAYMLTIIILTLMSNGGVSLIIPMLIKQILFGIITGSILARISVYILKRANFEVEGFYTIFVTAIAILSYALSEYIGGNGYLSVYMAGIILGNNRIPHKKSLVHFFDGLSWIMQIGLFFVLGLLAFPSKLPEVFVISIAISLFMMFIARPLATFIILKWFDYSNKEKIFISWVGFRGAASIVFAIYTVTYGVDIGNDIFHIIFFIALLSVSIQGTFTPILAKKLDLVDDNMPVLKTFNDYKEDKSTKILEINIDENSKWVNKTIMDSDIPEEVLVVMIRRNNEVIIPKGSTEIKKDDILVLASNSFDNLLAN
ncbi:potassium/proton antiporter [Clostridium sp.]|uniref:potassium/proton antiporter n=1 Tax=Clostridium sp. TaxID=1506 RepID=UPI0025FFB10C|nr:potassium/proton antiporter [Clostridium sp.]MDY6226999.1 potassium/proton antiporter [Clostridium sp.]